MLTLSSSVIYKAIFRPIKCNYIPSQLPGFPIFGTGQTSVDGFEKCLEPVLKKYGDEKHVFWVNLRSDNNNTSGGGLGTN